MKTPSSLPLLALFIAFPASAAIKAGDRCDTAFLEKVISDDAAGGLTIDADRVGYKKVDGVNIQVLKPGVATTCDPATWRHVDPAVWNNSVAQKYWKGWSEGNASKNAAFMLVGDDFFKKFDPKADAVLEAADAVIAAGVKLGFVTAADATNKLAVLLPGASGGRFGELKPKTVTAVEEKNQVANLGPDELGPTMRLLLDESGKKNGGGSAVLTFRLAVLKLNAEIARLGASNAAVAKRTGGAMPDGKDFLPGLPKGYVAPKADKATALDDVKFGAALTALIGARPVSTIGDGTPDGTALLNPVDVGVRNLVAVRAADVEKIVTLAKARLKGKKITALEVSARAAAVVKRAPNKLAGAVMERLAETEEYANLDVMYENNIREKGVKWAKTEEGQKAYAARASMQDAALSATIEKDGVSGREQVVFTQGGKKTILGSIVPPSGDGDDSRRNDIAVVITRSIVDGAVGDAKYQAVVDAIKGSGQPGKDLDTGLKGPELGVSRDVPPAVQKIHKGGAGCRDLTEWRKNSYDKYAMRKQAAASAMATTNGYTRLGLESANENDEKASAAACKARQDEAAEMKFDDFIDKDTVKAKRAQVVKEAKEWCEADRARVAAEVKARNERFAAREKGARDPGKILRDADADLAAAFSVAITGSIDQLRKDYTNPKGNSRLKKLISDAKLSGMSARLVAFTELWFAEQWPQDAKRKDVLEASVAACAKKLGLGPVKGGKINTKYSNPESPDTVDSKCDIRKDLASFIVKQKGTVSER